MVQGDISAVDIRFINGYGPQETAKIEDKLAFFSRLDQEMKTAKLFECFVCIEMDANSKVGPQVISGHSHPMSHPRFCQKK